MDGFKQFLCRSGGRGRGRDKVRTRCYASLYGYCSSDALRRSHLATKLPAPTAEYQTWPDGLVSRHAGRQLAVRR